MIVELWRGKSALDGSPVALLANMRSGNNKIGSSMIATYIWPINQAPSVGRGGGSMCPAGCPALTFCMNNDYPSVSAYDNSWRLQVASGRAQRVPRSAWRHFLRGRSIRFGVDGDCGALPLSVVQAMVKASGRPVADHTAYTHAHHRTDLNFLFMASCESFSQVPVLESAGWKCFVSVPVPGWSGRHDTFDGGKLSYLRKTIRQAVADHGISRPVVVCPNYISGVQCGQCLLCNRDRGRAHIVAPLHGAGGIRFTRQSSLAV
jgi:hypothetical protein